MGVRKYFAYQCKKCKKIQDKWHSMTEKNKERCDNVECNAPPGQLKKIPYRPTHHGHGSWSR